MSRVYGGKINLAAGKLPYFNTDSVASGENAEISFKPITGYDINKFTVYCAVNSIEAEKIGKEMNDSRFEIVVENNKAIVSYMDCGMRTELSEVDFPVKYNEINNLTLKTTAKGQQTLIEAWLNGVQVVNILADVKVPDGGYYGLWSEKISFEIQ